MEQFLKQRNLVIGTTPERVVKATSGWVVGLDQVGRRACFNQLSLAGQPAACHHGKQPACHDYWLLSRPRAHRDFPQLLKKARGTLKWSPLSRLCHFVLFDEYVAKGCQAAHGHQGCQGGHQVVRGQLVVLRLGHLVARVSRPGSRLRLDCTMPIKKFTLASIESF